VLFLQNHDQIGNRALGERLTTLAEPLALEAAIALQLLCPQIPLLFMGEETASTTPFFFFTDHNEELAKAVREGRRREFAGFAQFSDPKLLNQMPDPNAAETFDGSKPIADRTNARHRQQLYRTLLALRRAEIVPRLADTRAHDAEAVGPAAVTAHWRMGDASTLILASNLGPEPTAIPQLQDRVLFATSHRAQESARHGRLEPYSTIALLAPP
jgi:1,4-alpha-glucan branching enzyme